MSCFKVFQRLWVPSSQTSNVGNMSGKWEGFSEEDIKNINVGGPKVSQKSSSHINKPEKSSFRPKAKNNAPRERMTEVELNPVTNSMLLAPEATPVTSAETITQNATCESGAALEVPEKPVSILSGSSPNHIPVCIRIKDDKSYEVVGSPKVSLDEFQARQKLMEEQNRHRKELLGRALADRKKRTTAEARRLQQIQEELQKLDSLLSTDVSILRNQIEVASLEFSEAQKRYGKAEKEFLEAKLIMFGKLEQKELLTEHLCTIIEQNEMRKARKLSELMDKLELGVMTEVTREDPSKPPTVCFLNDVSDVNVETTSELQPEAEKLAVKEDS